MPNKLVIRVAVALELRLQVRLYTAATHINIVNVNNNNMLITDLHPAFLPPDIHFVWE